MLTRAWSQAKDSATADPVMDDAIAKIAANARWYDRIVDASRLRAFLGSPMTSPEFRSMYEKVFVTRLTLAEAKKIVSLFDHGENGTIEGQEFIGAFAQLSFVEKSIVDQERREKIRAINDREERERQRKLNEA